MLQKVSNKLLLPYKSPPETKFHFGLRGVSGNWTLCGGWIRPTKALAKWQ